MPQKTIFEFLDEQGGWDARLEVGHLLYLFPTGGRLQLTDPGNFNHGTMYEPPTDPLARLEAQQRYWRTLADTATKDFDLWKTWLTWTPNPDHPNPVNPTWREALYGPLPDRNPATPLRIIRDFVLRYRKELAAVEAELNRLPAVRERNRVAALKARRDREADAMVETRKAAERAEVESISLD